MAQEAHNIEIYRAGRSQPDRTVPLTGTQLIVGRNETAQVFLDHDTVSRPHAQLTCGPFGRWWIHDLGSTNGTYVNGTRVKERMLNPGDEVRIGDYTLRLSLPRQPALSTTPPAQPTPVVSDTYDDMSPVPASSREAPRIDATLLSTAMALGRRLMTIEDPRGRLEELCNFLIGRDFPAVAAIALRMRGRDELKVLHGPVHRNGPAAVGGHYSRRVLQAVWQDRDAVLATNATSLKHVKKITLPGSIRPMAVVACPIWADDERLDVLYVELPATHGTDEWRTLVTLVADAYKQADLMWDMRRHVRSSAFVERELEMARQIQDSLVPTRRFDLLDVAIGYEPCRWVGGDYVDATTLPDGRILLAVADVCGKGLQAALVASSLHTMVNATMEAGGGMVDMMGRINRYLMSYLPNHSFVTIACVALDPATGVLECVNAGHPPPFIVKRDGSMRPLQSERNLALGIADMPLEVERTALAGDEVLLLYTDGLTELIDESKNLMGEERFASAVRSIVADNGHQSAERLKNAILRMIEDYRGWQLANDDTTFLVARRRIARAA